MLRHVIITLIAIHCGGTLEEKDDLYLEQQLLKYGRHSSVPATGWDFCFEKKCRCNGDEADCSKNYGNLTFVPKLPDDIRFLNFSYNNLTSIDRADFFQNVTNIEFVDLGDNGLRYIHPEVFRPLKRLRDLFLDYNNALNYTTLQPVFSVKSLERLDIRHGSLGPLPVNLFYRFPLPRLRYMYWDQNKLGSLNFTALKPVSSLISVGLDANQIVRVQSDFMPRLEHLLVTENALQYFPATCSPNGTSYFPQLTNLFLRDNQIFKLPLEICLPNLKMLQLSGNHFYALRTDAFSGLRFPALVQLYLKAMIQHILQIEEKVFNNSLLETISLMSNSIQFQKNTINVNFLSGCTRIRSLKLDGNVFTRLNDKRFFQMFGHLTQLVDLSLGNSFIQQVTPKMFANFKRLESLHLNGNHLHELPHGVFDKKNLTELFLQGNRLRQISSSTFDQATRQRLQSLDLSDNLFSCTCELRWFRDWLIEQPSLFAKSQGRYMCSDTKNVSVALFYLPDQACLMTTDTYKFIVASVCLLTFILTLLSSLYRYRWHIRLVLYETFRDKSDARRRRLQEQPYNYDVFVSYAADDLWWVQTRLMPELEQRLALRLCLHQRDFLAGKNIVDNIMDTVNDSKKVLMVFSTCFARSHWCQFELAFCLRHVLEKDEDLIVVCLEELASRDLTSVMMAVLKTNTYIQWQDQPEATASFWGRLQVSLQEILPRPV